MDDKQMEALKQRLIQEFRNRGLSSEAAEAEAVDMLRRSRSRVAKLETEGGADQLRPGIAGWRKDRDEFELAAFIMRGADSSAPLPDRVVANIDERTEEKKSAAQEAIDKGGSLATEEEKQAASEARLTLGGGQANALDDQWVENYLNENSTNPDMVRIGLRALFGRMPTRDDIEEIAAYINDSGAWGDYDPDDEQNLNEVMGLLVAANGDRSEVSGFDPIVGEALGEQVKDTPELVRRWRIGNKDYEVDETRRVLLFAGADGEGKPLVEKSAAGDSQWEAGGWLKDRPDLFRIIVQEASDAGIDSTTLAASLFYQGALGALAGDRGESQRAVKDLDRFGGDEKTSSAGLQIDESQAVAKALAGAKNPKQIRDQAAKEKDPAKRQGMLAAAAQAEAANKATADKVKGRYSRRRQALAGQAAARRQAQSVARTTANRLAVYEKQYGGPLPAIIAMVDEGLAARMRDGTIVGADDLFRIDEIMQQSRYGPGMGEKFSKDNPTTRKQYMAWTSAWQTYLDEQSGGGRASEQPVVTYSLPDANEVRESMRTIFRAWFQRDPSDMEVNGFKSTLDRAVIDSANQQAQAEVNGGNYTTPDAESMLSDFVRNSPEYRQLFANKPGGMSEEQYAGSFRSAGTDFFGDIVDDEAVRAGMMSGSTQTTMGRLAASKKSEQSSSYQERLARAAEVIASMT